MAQMQLLHFLIFVTILLAKQHASSLVSNSNNETDWHALLSFKSMISDDSRGSLASWNDSTHFCEWPGVTCGRRHPQRVASLVLSSRGLSGFISPAISNLTFLKEVDLSDNQFRGNIPQELGRLFRLRYLNLSANSLEGAIPATLFNCQQLEVLSMRSTGLTGEIPPTLSNCSNLRIINFRNNSLTGHISPALTNFPFLSFLMLSFNQLTGSIPATIGNLYSLKLLSFGFNHLSGTIPPSIGKLSKLTTLDLSDNQLTGAIPPSFWNLSSISVLFVATNNLSGPLPENVGQLLPLVKRFNLFENQFSGRIPVSLSNASHLERIELDYNMFIGTIPPELGSLPNLEWFKLPGNLLEAKNAKEWSFMDNLSNCTNLSLLQLDLNKLSGTLPRSIANLSTNLQKLTIGGNEISGNIMPEIANLVSLTYLDFGPNMLTGPIPASIGMLQNMYILDLDINRLSGEIPSTLGNLTQLTELYLGFNQLTGTIPTSLGNCQNLALLNIQANNLTGGIPRELLTISTLSRGLALSYNSLTGPIPPEIGTLKNLVILDVQNNKLSGEIPSTIGECRQLEGLFVSSNFFRGSIPSTLSGLGSIQQLDLSQNNFSGRIPDFLQDFHFLINLNLSFNDFEGAIPVHGAFANTSAVSVVGNKNLCGGNPEMHLPDCPSRSQDKKHHSQLTLILSIAGSLLFLILLFCVIFSCCWVRKSRRKHLHSAPQNELDRVSYAELVRATNGFSEDNLIGSGSFAKVYKGILHDHDSGKVVAVKVMNLQREGANKSFMAECEALRNIRHRNLVKILTVCSSIDFEGNEFKALILDFMVNGSLNDWLHHNENEQSQPKRLTLTQRINIAINVASALDYLHNYGEPPIVHCDLKPSNVLLDVDMIAHVGDFGIARILKDATSNSSQYSTSSVGLKGTIGYLPPEYGMANRVSTKGDVYSYGILLLEMFTAKSPTDGIFMEGLSLRKFVKMAFPQRVTDVIDAQLLSARDGEETDGGQHIDGARAVQCIASVLQIGILCSNESPAERLEMGEVIRELHNIRECFQLNPGR